MGSVVLKVGEVFGQDSSELASRAGKQGDQIVSELHGRFYEGNYRNKLFSGGMTTTSINAATFTTATTGATATPILGVYNPANSGKNLSLLQAVLSLVLTAGTATGPGTFQWCVTPAGQNGLTLGAAPWSRSTLLQAGSVAKNMAGVALTGISGVLSILGASALMGGSNIAASFVETAVGARPSNGGVSVENLDGSILVPPGFAVGLFCTTTPVAHSAGSNLIWEELPL